MMIWEPCLPVARCSLVFILCSMYVCVYIIYSIIALIISEQSPTQN